MTHITIRRLGLCPLLAGLVITWYYIAFDLHGFQNFLEATFSPDGHISDIYAVIIRIHIVCLTAIVFWLTVTSNFFSERHYLNKASFLVCSMLVVFHASCFTRGGCAGLYREDGLFESLTAILALLTSVLFLASIRGDKDRANSLALLLSVFFFAFGMEEISWGQRIFGWDTPDKMAASNFQGETNIHNFFNPYFGPLYPAFNLLLGTALLVPARVKVKLASCAKLGRLMGLVPASEFRHFGFIFLILCLQSALFTGEVTEEVVAVFGLTVVASYLFNDKLKLAVQVPGNAPGLSRSLASEASAPVPKLTVSLIVPAHRDGHEFRRCIASVMAADPPPEEIIVVVDGGCPNLCRHVEKLGLDCVRTPSKRGPAVARNLGARAASGDVLFFVDSDVTVPRSVISQVKGELVANSEVAAVVGSYDDQPAVTGFLSQYKNLFHHYMHQTASEQATTFWGACGAVRRLTFLRIGGFEESYDKPSIEDIELGYQLIATGHKIRLCKDLQVKHLKRWRAVSLFKTDFFQRALPWSKLILSSGQFANDLNIGLRERAKVALLFAFVGALLTSCLWLPALAGAGVIAAALLALDLPLLRFFCRKRGRWFAVMSIPWQWFYYGYSGLAFICGIFYHLLHRSRSLSIPLLRRRIDRQLCLSSRRHGGLRRRAYELPAPTNRNRKRS